VIYGIGTVRFLVAPACGRRYESRSWFLPDRLATPSTAAMTGIYWDAPPLGFLDTDRPAIDVPDRSSAAVRWGLIAFAGVATLQVVMALIHSPWRDETEALLIGRQPLDQLFGMLHYEGHPALWYLLLAVASKVSASPIVLQVVQAAIAVGFQAILWRYAPFSWPMKLLISLGYFMVFEYGVIARNYGLGVLLFFAFVAFRRTRWSWLLLALTCNTAVHLAMLAWVGALLLLFVERRWSWRGMALLMVSSLIALATITPAADVFPPPVAGRALSAHLVRAIVMMSSDIWPVPVGFFPTTWLWGPPAPIDFAVGLLAPILGVLALRRDWRLAGAFLIFCLGLLFIGSVVYPIQPRHAGLIVILLIALLWIEKDLSGADPDLFARLWLTALAACGIWIAGCSFFQPFSYARPLSDWIRERKLADAPWAAFPGVLGTDFTGQFGRPTFNIQKACWNTYQRWNYNYKDKPRGAPLGQRLEAMAEAVGPTYLITDAPLDAGSTVRTQPVATFSGAMFSGREEYPQLRVYRIDPARLTPRTLPTCS
jgi:hypothetical protein